MKIKEKIKIKTAVSWTGAELLSGDPTGFLENISTDSRTLRAGDLFIPIKGENFDGHNFISDALSTGAGGFVYEIGYEGRLKEVLADIRKKEKNIDTLLEISCMSLFQLQKQKRKTK